MSRSIQAILVGLALCGVAGCTAPAGETDSASGEAAVETARATSFACRIGEDWDFDLGLTFADDGKTLSVSWGLDNIVEGEGTIDPDYRPQPGNANYVRYVGFSGLADAFGEAPVRTTVLIEKPLLEGKAGHAKLQFLHANEFDQRVNGCEPVEPGSERFR